MSAIRFLFVVFLLHSATVVAIPFGINAHVASTKVLDQIVDLGTGWIRIDFVWAVVEFEEDNYDWSLYDRLVADAQQRNIKIFATLAGTPQWATSGPEFSGPPDDFEEWQEFCYLAARRYRGRIQAWSFWNEPNLTRFWTGSRQQYMAEILDPGMRAVRMGDPNALLCGPGLAHLNSGSWDSWLRNIMAEFHDRFDVVTHHAYPSGSNASDVARKLADGPSYPWEPPAVFSILSDFDWDDRPIWLTETGLDSEIYGTAEQASFYANLLSQWYGPNRRFSWLRRIFFYHIHDDPRLPEIGFGILEEPPDLAPKEAFTAYRDFIDQTPVFDADIAVDGFPASIIRGTSTTLTYTLTNTGSRAWPPLVVRLRVKASGSGWAIEGGLLPDDVLIQPGYSVAIPVSITAPITTNIGVVEYAVEAQMESSTGENFGRWIRRKIEVVSTPPPRIVVQSPSRSVEEGNATTLSLIAIDDFNLSYQWYHNSVPLQDGDGIRGAETSVLRINPVDLHSIGDYVCEVSSTRNRSFSEPILVALSSQGGPDAGPRHPRNRRTTLPNRLSKWLDHVSHESSHD